MSKKTGSRPAASYRDEMGRYHATEAACRKANEIIAAVCEYDKARANVSRLILSSATTADGVRFDELGNGTLWTIDHHYLFRPPTIREFYACLWNATVETVEIEEGTAKVVARWYNHSANRYEEARIQDCYATKDAAQAAHDEAWGKYAASVAKQHEEHLAARKKQTQDTTKSNAEKNSRQKN